MDISLLMAGAPATGATIASALPKTDHQEQAEEEASPCCDARALSWPATAVGNTRRRPGGKAGTRTSAGRWWQGRPGCRRPP